MRDVGRTVAAIREIAHASQGETGVVELLERICAVVSEAFEFDRVSVARYHAAAREVSNLVLVGDAPDAIPARLPLDEVPLLARAMETRTTVYVSDVRRQDALPQELVEAYGVTSILCVPLLSAGRCLGFVAADRRGHPFHLDDIELATLDMVGVITATMLEKVLVQEELQRLDATKSEFIAIASHELRTPLTSVYGISATLDERGDELDDDARRQLRRALREQTQHLRSLVEQLLDLSRFDVAALDISPERMRLLPRVQDLVGLAGLQAVAVLDVDPALEAEIDPAALDRIASNLLANARNYGAPPIHVSATADDSQLLLTVEDRGPGVADDFVARLFDRFSRSSQSAAEGGGSGLGLAIARAYARAHGGDLIYEHAEPHGARFVLKLPHHPPPRDPYPDESPARTPPPAWADEPTTAHLHPVVVEASPPEAAAALRELLDDYHATLVGGDRVEIEPIDTVRRGTVIYRTIQAAATIANRFPTAKLNFVAEDGNHWRLPPPPL